MSDAVTSATSVKGVPVHSDSAMPSAWTSRSFGNKAKQTYQISWTHTHHPERFFMLADVGMYITIMGEPEVLEILLKALASEQRLTKLRLEGDIMRDHARIYTRGMDIEQLALRVREELDAVHVADTRE